MQIHLDAPVPQWDLFEHALECAEPELRSYYDTVTGEVHLTGPFEDDPGEREMIEADPARFIAIDHLPSHERFEWMARFAAEEVEDEALRGRLERALVGRGCFRRFKDVLLAAPEERARWFRYSDQLLKQAIERWFDEHELPVGVRPPWWPASQDATAAAG
jgi:hypothetical protein